MSTFLGQLSGLLITGTDQLLNNSGEAEKVTCGSKIDQNTFYLYLLIPATLLTILLSFTQKRQSYRTNIFHGRPGLVYPMNFLGRSKRFIYGSAFGAITYLCLQLLLNGRYVVEYKGPAALTVFPLIFSVLVYGIDYYPLFTALAVDSFIGYIVGSLYSLMLLLIFCIQNLVCDQSVAAGILLTLLHILPIFLCLISTTVGFPIRMVIFLRKKLKPSRITYDDKYFLDKIRNSYHGLHVRKLLEKKDQSKVTEDNSSKWNRMIGFIKTWVYSSLPNFRYSTRIVSVLIMGIIVMYVLASETLIMVVVSFDKYRTAVYHAYNIGVMSSVGKDNRIKIYNILQDCVIVSMILPFIIGVLNIIHCLTSYRTDLLTLYKGKHKIIPKPEGRQMENSSLLSASIRYGGYQVAYIGWALVIQFVTCLILTLILAFFIHVDALREWFVEKLLQLIPTMVTVVVIIILQLVLSRFVFLQNDARGLAIDNRIMKALAIGLFFLSRLDRSNLPERFQSLDPGFKAYVGFLSVESTHTNPVMITFVKLLMNCRRRTYTLPDQNRTTTLKYLVQNVFDYDQMYDVESGNSQGKISKRAIQRWHLFYTLINNPEMQTLRRTYVLKHRVKNENQPV